MAQGKAEQLLLVIRKAVAQHGQGVLQHAGHDQKEKDGAEYPRFCFGIPAKQTADQEE